MSNIVLTIGAGSTSYFCVKTAYRTSDNDAHASDINPQVRMIAPSPKEVSSRCSDYRGWDQVTNTNQTKNAIHLLLVHSKCPAVVLTFGAGSNSNWCFQTAYRTSDNDAQAGRRMRFFCSSPQVGVQHCSDNRGWEQVTFLCSRACRTYNNDAQAGGVHKLE